MFKTWYTLTVVFASLLVFGCGGEEDDDVKVDGNSEEGGPGSAWVVVGTDSKVEVTFKGASDGSQFVVMPYSIGDLDEPTISAATVDITVKKPAASTGASLHLLKPEKVGEGLFLVDMPWQKVMNAQHYDGLVRTLHNRFDARRGVDQPKGFWRLASTLDEVTDVAVQVNGTTETHPTDGGFVTAYEKHVAKAAGLPPKSEFALTQASCPEEDDEVDFTDDGMTLSGTFTDGGTYCLVVMDDPATAGSADDVKAALAEVLKTFKDTILKDEMTGATDYAFKPILIIVDPFSNDNWPNNSAAKKDVSGLFDSNASSEKGMPIIIMPADYSKSSKFSGTAAAALKDLWYSALVHEIKHASTHFYKTKKAGTEELETLAIDEAGAHLMEDAFGYGEANFPLYQLLFLQNFLDAAGGPLQDADDMAEAAYRGGAHALMYYLVSQKGGVTYADGKISGGDGLTFFGDHLKSSGRGAKDLAKVYGADWVETIGNFWAAVALDGSGLENVKAIHKTQEVQSGLKDVSGGSSKSYGMSFNNFSVGDANVPNRITAADAYAELEEDKIEGLDVYNTQPILVKTSDATATMTFTFDSTAKGIGATVVQIK